MLQLHTANLLLRLGKYHRFVYLCVVTFFYAYSLETYSMLNLWRHAARSLRSFLVNFLNNLCEEP